MSDFALLDGSAMASIGTDPTDANGTYLTLPAGLNAMGAWTTVVASTPAESVGLVLNLGVWAGTPAAAEVVLMDIGIGAAGSEKVLVPQLYLATPVAPWFGTASYFIPIAVPAGQRLSARYQVQGHATSNGYAYVQLISGGLGSPPPLSRVTAYGSIPASTTVASVPGNAAAYAKGAWTQLVAATANPIQSLVFASRGSFIGYVDIGVGASGSEVIIVPDFQISNSGLGGNTVTQTVPVSVPAGTSLSARFLSGAAADTVKVGLWGID